MNHYHFSASLFFSIILRKNISGKRKKLFNYATFRTIHCLLITIGSRNKC